MKLKKILINNFRKLKNDIEIDILKETFIVGKNNTGKTSLSEIMYKFLTTNRNFKFEDFSSSNVKSENINKILDIYEIQRDTIVEESFKNLFPSITLEIFIEIENEDNLFKIKPLIYEFENNNNLIVSLSYECNSCIKIINDYKEYNSKLSNDHSLDELTFFEFFKREWQKYYSKKAFVTKEHRGYMHPVDIKEVIKLFNIGLITAQREVDDTSEQNTQNISNAIWTYYQNLKKDKVDLNQEDAFKISIESIKGHLNNEYSEMFEVLLGVINENVSESKNHSIEITSEFSIEEVLKKNSKIKYTVDNLAMPESYNGLGFSNLMYMLIQLITFIDLSKKEEKIFNILFIEEPESHLHPQMQTTFLKRIEELLNEVENNYTIITTHSSYILQTSNLNGVRYFTEVFDTVQVKSLQKFLNNPMYASLATFMKKYLKINTCDLFFADKAILVEGTVERMLTNVLIQKFDEEFDKQLAKQHLTLIEVGGAYANIFDELLEFLNLKTLIITDIDSVIGPKSKSFKCDLSNDELERLKTSNNVIKKWKSLEQFAPYIKDIVNACVDKSLLIEKNIEGIEKKMLTFQRPIKDEIYWGRTFEEQFIIENIDQDIIHKSLALKEAAKKTSIDNILDSNDSFDKAILKVNVFEVVKKIDKTNFALDLLAIDDWIIPNYIKEGFLWLEQ